MLHSFRHTQFLKTSPGKAWEFFSAPGNLATITPPSMGFEVLSQNSETNMYQGQIIEYYVRPLAGMRMHWVTEITHVKEGEFFVDEQRFGPYAFWHHKHFFRSVENGVEMTDEIHYKVPFGIIGKLANRLFVKRKLAEIFRYRQQKIEALFGS